MCVNANERIVNRRTLSRHISANFCMSGLQRCHLCPGIYVVPLMFCAFSHVLYDACFLYGEKAKDGCSSEKERKVNALALIAEEGRDNLRKATVSWK